MKKMQQNFKLKHKKKIEKKKNMNIDPFSPKGNDDVDDAFASKVRRGGNVV